MKLVVMLMVFCCAALSARAGEGLKVGDPAPDFTLANGSGGSNTLSALRGQWVVLYFYPKAFTPGCTTEACSLRDGHDGLTALNAVVLGVSLDGVEKLKEFKEKYNLPFELLSDGKKEVAKAYDSLALGGLFAKRHTFIIDPDGKVAYVFESVNVKEHDREVREVLTKLQATRASASK